MPQRLGWSQWQLPWLMASTISSDWQLVMWHVGSSGSETGQQHLASCPFKEGLLFGEDLKKLVKDLGEVKLQ